MQSNTVPPAKIFSGDRRYVVPLFQRPYVWKQDEQWAPLWDDVRLLAERVPTDPQAYDAPPVPPHFLGAIVLDQMQTATGYLEVRHVVDGQQRMTTLQLLLSAVADVVGELGDPMDTQALTSLVTNQLTQTPDDVFKVWPTNQDQDAFRSAMSQGKKGTSRIEDAWTFFRAAAATWAQEGQDPAVRLKALTSALRTHLRLVVIDLEPGDNAQVIFETLNHRGAPLLAADLIKNHLFQGAQVRQLNVQALYDDHWKQLDSDYWRQLVPQGRRNRPRIDIFFTYWLTMTTLKEVPVDHVFDVFKTATAGRGVDETITELARDADVYRQMEALPADSVEGAFYYRVLRALDTAAVGPFLLWLLRGPAERLPIEQRQRALRAVESWLIRRTLCRLTGADINSVVLALLQTLAQAGPAEAGSVTETFLAGQTANSRLWPGDDTVKNRLADMPLYESITRPRLRMILERLEDDVRGELGEGERCPLRLTVEHVMPRGWRTYWDNGLDELAALARDRLVHSLGNLTLVSNKLNPTLSNAPWTAAEAAAAGLKSAGKKALLLEHSTLKLNARLVTQHDLAWTEEDIRARTAALSERIVALWPRPAGAVPTVAPAADEALLPDDPEDDDTAARYAPLQTWLEGIDLDEVSLTLDHAAWMLGGSLPSAARTDAARWESNPRRPVRGDRGGGLAGRVFRPGGRAGGAAPHLRCSLAVDLRRRGQHRESARALEGDLQHLPARGSEQAGCVGQVAQSPNLIRTHGQRRTQYWFRLRAKQSPPDNRPSVARTCCAQNAFGEGCLRRKHGETSV